MRSTCGRLLAAALLAALTVLALSGPAPAATGDNLRTITADQSGTACADANRTGDASGAIGTGIAFDGTNLLVSCWQDDTIVEINPANGAQIAIHHISGLSSPSTSLIGALAWDNTTSSLWACNAEDRVGTIDLVANTFTFKFTVVGCVDGLGYDANDDTVWASADAAPTIQHYALNGTLLSSTNISAALCPGGGNCGNSGIGVGGPKLYLANNGGQQIFEATKDFSSINLFASFPRRLEDLECDNITFLPQNKAAIWSNDAYDNILNAWEIPFGVCLFGGGPPAQITLSPKTDVNVVGNQHCVTATVTNAIGNPKKDIQVVFSASGANTAGGSATTDANGQATFCYTGTHAGLDTIKAFADANKNGVQDADEPSDTAAKTWLPGPPATLVLAPKTATNTVDSQHCVTATVKDQFGNATPAIVVRFSVAGSVTTSGSATTDASGQATFCYTGPPLAGTDAIHAYADTNNNNLQNPGEPGDDAAKTWVLPPSTQGCKVTYGGRITTTDGDMATFGGNAMVPASGAQGEEEYQDHGPLSPMNVHSIVVDVVTCSRDGTSATIFGTATLDGAGSFAFRIDLKDLGEPGTSDTYRIRLSNGYDSGTQLLNHGNVQIHF
jgi:Bacterial Ig-like domain (group 1)